MKLETFFENFEMFADTPNAVAKMRELVLELAVTGRLSERRANDAPVGDLIGALSAAKIQRLNKGRSPAVAEGAVQVEVERPVVVPDHWAWVPLNEIGCLSGGMTPSKAKAVFWDGDVNWFSSKDIKPDELTESELKITREGVKATGLQPYSPGCLVMVTRSGILKHTFPVSILRVEGTVNQDLKVLSPFVGGLERYLQIMLRGLNGFIITSLVKTGMTVQSLKFDEFKLQPFPLPPLAEQKRIVAKVDELMALCDRLEAQQQEREEKHKALSRASLARFADAPTPANLQFIFHPSYTIAPADLRKSILTLAVQGKLVPQDPNDEPAEELIKIINFKRSKPIKEGTIKKKELLPEITDQEIPYDSPDGWVWSRMGDLAHYQKGYAFKSEDYLDSGLMITKIKNLTDNNTKNSVYITPERAKEFNQYLIHENDIVMTTVGSWFSAPISAVGRSFVINAMFDNSLLNQNAVRIRFWKELAPMYFFICINSQIFKSYLIQEAQGTANQASITQESIKNFLVCVPPLAEQLRIVAKMEELMKLVDELETQLAASRATAANLLAALVAELTGTPNNGKVSLSSSSGTGRRGRPPKSS